jgi:hypothetical protein
MPASQLPESTDDALIILRLTAQLVTDFLTRPELRDCATTQQADEAQKPNPVVAFVRAPGDARHEDHKKTPGLRIVGGTEGPTDGSGSNVTKPPDAAISRYRMSWSESCGTTAGPSWS